MEHRERTGLLRRLGIAPVLRLAAWAARTGLARARLALTDPFVSRPARLQRRAAWRRNAAQRAAVSLGELRGVWVKAGQFAAHRHDLLPAEATAALGVLRDRVPPLPLPRIRAAIERELGRPLPELFAHFDPRPLGAASIAQVHRAVLHDGTEVAVKVQYPGLESTLAPDLAWVRFGLRLLARRSGSSGAPERLLAEFESGLRAELDFEREARVAVEIARNLEGDERIVVPGIVAGHSTRRVLTMHYHPCVRITDGEGLERLGVEPGEVLEIVARAYARQVFVDGLFHADPHPGNLFVIDEPGAAAAPRVLFVDFGLSRRLEPELRRAMRQGVYALIQRDADAFLDRMTALGMVAVGAEPEVRSAVQHMFDRIGQQGGALAVRSTAVLSLKDEAQALLSETPGLQLPNDLLLFARTLASVFSLGEELDPDTDLMTLTLPYLLQFLAEKD